MRQHYGSTWKRQRARWDRLKGRIRRGRGERITKHGKKVQDTSPPRYDPHYPSWEGR